MKFEWLVFIALCILFAQDLGLPDPIAWVALGLVLAFIVLMLVGVL